MMPGTEFLDRHISEHVAGVSSLSLFLSAILWVLRIGRPRIIPRRLNVVAARSCSLVSHVHSSASIDDGSTACDISRPGASHGSLVHATVSLLLFGPMQTFLHYTSWHVVIYAGIVLGGGSWADGDATYRRGQGAVTAVFKGLCLEAKGQIPSFIRMKMRLGADSIVQWPANR